MADDVDGVAGIGVRSSTKPYAWPWWSWALTLLSYVVLGYLLKSIVLNWIVGPLYPLLVMYVLPAGLRRLLGRFPARPATLLDDVPS